MECGSHRKLQRRELVLIGVIAALSIVIKPYVRMPFGFIQTAFGMPVGAFLGGVYMFWPVAVGVLVPKPGAVFLTCLLQGLVAILSGFTGLLGPAAFFSYVASGLVMELLLLAGGLFATGRTAGVVLSAAAGAAGNLTGAAVNAYLFFALKGTATAVVAGMSLWTGALGGWLAFVVARRVRKATRGRFRCA